MRALVPVLKTVLLVTAASWIITGCQKSVNEPLAMATNPAPVILPVQDFRISASRLVLLQGNEASAAATFSWKPGAGNASSYAIEAAISGTSFSDPVTLITTTEPGVSFSVKDFNAQMCKLMYANNTAKIDFRVRSEYNGHGKLDVAYSPTIAIDITTYQNYTTYTGLNVMRLPGNYQNWNVPNAPQIVSAVTPGEYEGYVNFTAAYPQILMVKGSSDWDAKNTYSYVGNDMFGFGGSVISIFGGAGIYLFRASTNTNKWSYTKVNNWDLAGTAVQGDATATPAMKQNPGNISWSVTTNLVKGSFRIRANGSDAISFGHKVSDEAGVPSYTGDDIAIKSAGNYTIRLELGVAGNYAYSILKNN